MTARWSAKLARAIILRDGTQLATLSDARAYILALPNGDRERNSWLHAGELLLEAGEHNGDIADATGAIETALFLQARWLPAKKHP